MKETIKNKIGYLQGLQKKNCHITYISKKDKFFKVLDTTETTGDIYIKTDSLTLRN